MLTCTIEVAYQTDNGEYWCETAEEKSNTVNITVTGMFILLYWSNILFIRPY